VPGILFHLPGYRGKHCAGPETPPLA